MNKKSIPFTQPELPLEITAPEKMIEEEIKVRAEIGSIARRAAENPVPVDPDVIAQGVRLPRADTYGGQGRSPAAAKNLREMDRISTLNMHRGRGPGY